MNVLVLGGTGFFGIHMVKRLLERGHGVTIATRGRAKDSFGDRVSRVTIERTDRDSMTQALGGRHFDAVCDNLAICSNDVKYLLDAVTTERYVMTSSASVYSEKLGPDTAEATFEPLKYGLKWCGRKDYDYDEIKRQAECALFQAYPGVNAAAVRFPYVTGSDDYTKRLFFYVDHAVRGVPMFIDNMDAKLGFIHSTEAGAFLAWLAEDGHTGPVNGGNAGAYSVGQVLAYVEGKTGAKAVLSQEGEPGPYNGDSGFDLNTERAGDWGFAFREVSAWMGETLDGFIELAKSNE